MRNITSKLPERLHREVKGRYWQILDDAVTVAEAKTGLLALAGDYRASYPSAMKTIDEHVDQLVGHLRFPLAHRKRTRSTNLLERTFVEVRRRKVITLCIAQAMLGISSGERFLAVAPDQRHLPEAA